MGKWIYYVEDDTSIRELVLYALKTAEFQVMGFENAASFYKRMKEQQPDLILLDIMLPDEDGVSILKKLKSRPDTENIPVIMMTAKSSEYDKVLGLDSGADDYITKPFGVMERISRVKAVIRRSDRSKGSAGEVLKIGELVLDCLLYTSDAADEEDSVDLGGRRIIKKKKNREIKSIPSD